MTTTVKSQQEFYDQYKNEVLGLADELTDFSEGSLHDIIAGALSTAQNELSELIISEFSKTFFELAEGQDLEKLAVDHFGESFARPEPTKSTGEVQFSRPNTDAGNVTIPIGTIVKTVKDANGSEIRFETTEEVTMTGLTDIVQIAAVDAGKSSNITSTGKIIVIESTLTDSSVVVTNLSNTAGGTDEPTDAEYREIIKNLIVSLAGATEAAVKGAALSVAGVAIAELTTEERVVIDYDIGNDQILSGATYFRIPKPVMYIADSSGNSSDALIQAVKDRIFSVKAAGVTIEVKGAIPVAFNWSASLTLNVSGPNYAELSQDLTKIIETMTEYVNSVLTIGQGFNKVDANNYVLSVWGSSGTNDITSFSSSIPSGNVSVAANEKLIANTIQIV